MRADIRHALRLLFSSRAFALTALLSFSVAIGANTVVFSVVHTVLLKPISLPQSDRLAVVWQANVQKGWQKYEVASGNYFDWKRENRSFEELAILNPYVSAALTGHGYPERLEGAAVSAEFFEVLRTEPLQGRTFRKGDDAPGRNHLVVLSHNFWVTRFASDSKLLSKTILLNGTPHTVIGIMRRDFPVRAVTPDYGVSTRQPLYWTPLVFDKAQMTFRQYGDFRVIGRLKERVTVEQARQEVQSIMARLAQQFPETNRGWSAEVVSLQEQTAGGVQKVLLLLAIAVGVVLLAACANIGGLAVARSFAREREMAVRVAFGATRLRIVRQLLIEGLTLSTIGGILGCAAAYWGIRLLTRAEIFELPRREEIAMDLPVALFSMALATFAGLLFGVAPALRTRAEIAARGISATKRERLYQDAFIVAEVCLSFFLLIGAGLLLNSLLRLRSVETGFDARNLLTFQVTLPLKQYSEAQQRTDFFRRTLDRFRQLPGVQSVGGSSSLPFMRVSDQAVVPFTIKGELPQPQKGNLASARAITPEYFRTMRIHLRAGREFTDLDATDTTPVMIVNEALAQRAWSGRDALGRMVTVEPGPDGRPLWRRVVGVVRNVRSFGLDAEEQPGFYIPYSQFSIPWLVFAMRTEGDPMRVLTAVRQELAAIDPSRPVSKVTTMTEMIAGHLRPQTASLTLIGLLAAIALGLASIGLYALLTFIVSRRGKELAIRFAVGARVEDVVRLVLRRGVLLAGIGVILGGLASLAFSRLLAGWLYGVTPTDPLTYAAAALFVLILSGLAASIPARRAGRVDPIQVLRHE